ncbi:MAG: hypothetical protein D6707_01900 [Bacteroidetes bacterium]|nr:MAG: hypothetical protein D6707_01900 [Bacteroidota bacterium]
MVFLLKKTFAGLETYNRALPNTVTFQVVVKTSKDLPPGFLKNFDLIQKEIKEEGIFEYHLGQFKKFKTAEMYRQIVVQQGFKNAEIYGYFRKRRVSMEDALALANNHNKYDAAYEGIKEETMSVEELNALLDLLTYQKHLYFSVQADKDVDDNTIQLMKKERYFGTVETETGDVSFIAGKFMTYEQAVAFRKQILKNGGCNVYVTAYINEKRIPTEQAVAYCEKIMEKTMVYNDNQNK